MQLIRIIHQKHFDRNRGRFQSLAFRPSSNGGISVIDGQCALANTGSLCQHLRHYYAHVSGCPPLFWLFDAVILPSAHLIEVSPSDSQDACHRDIKNLTPREAERTFKSHAVFPSSFHICPPRADHRPLEPRDLDL